MQKLTLKIFLSGIIVLGMGTTVHAQDPFQLTWESRVLSSGSLTVKGFTTLYLVNTSGSDLKDATIRPATFNKVTYNSQEIPIGDIEDGNGRGAAVEWSVPVEATSMAFPEQPAYWHLEYLDARGNRVAFDIPEAMPR